MAVASLLDAGADEKVLLEVLKTIPAHGFDIKISRVSKSGLDCCDFNVVLDKDYENHDHDMEYLLDMTTHTVMSIWKNMSIMKTTHIYKKIHIIMSIEIYLMLLL